MKIADIRGIATGKVVVYRRVRVDEFEDLYRGYLCEAPDEILEMEIENMSAREGAVLDISVGGRYE